MNRKIGALAAAAAAVGLLLCGCGGKENPDAVHYGLVTDAAGVTNGAVSEVSAGMELAAQAHSFRTQIYSAADDSDEALAAAFKAAAEEGTQYILSCGSQMEVPAADAQGDYPKSRFLLFDGVPQTASGKTAEIRKNMMCVTFDRESMGFLAGYGAVRAGMRRIGYMTGTPESETSAEYFNGFVNGAGYASQIMELGAGGVTVVREYAGTEDLSPMRMTDAQNLLDDAGVEMLATDIAAFVPALSRAASSRGKYLATIGFDTGDGSAVLASRADHQGAVEWLLTQFEADGKSFAGGTVLEAGAKEHAVTMRADYSALAGFTETDLINILDTLSQLAENDSESESGLTEGGNLIAIEEHEPVTPDPNAGSV